MEGEKITIEFTDEDLAAIDASWEAYRVQNESRIIEELNALSQKFKY